MKQYKQTQLPNCTHFYLWFGSVLTKVAIDYAVLCLFSLTMKTILIVIGGILLLMSLTFTRFKYNRLVAPTMSDASRRSMPAPEPSLYQPENELVYEQQYYLVKQQIMAKYNSFQAQIYQSLNEMILKCIGTIISDSTLIAAKECATSPESLLIVFKCHKLDKQNIPTEFYRILESEVTKLTTIGDISLISFHPSHPSERCVVLWPQDSQSTRAIHKSRIDVQNIEQAVNEQVVQVTSSSKFESTIWEC